MARTRLIRPTFFSDKKMAALPDSTRLVYIGLWTLCDDAGFFDFDVAEIAVALFPWEGPKRRERRIADAIERLVVAGRVDLLECGEHAIVPKLPDHRQKGGETLFTIRKRHEARCLRRRSGGLHSPATEDSVSDSVSDSSPSPDSLDALAREEPTTKKRPGESFADWSARVAASSGARQEVRA